MLGITPLSIAADVTPMVPVFPTPIAQLLDKLAGKTWVAEVERGGRKIRIEETIDWTPSRTFLQSEVKLFTSEGKLLGINMGVLGWNPLRAKLQMWQFAHDGSFSACSQVQDRREGAYSFEVRNMTGTCILFATASSVVGDDPPTVTTTVVPVPVGDTLTPLAHPVVFRLKDGSPS